MQQAASSANEPSVTRLGGYLGSFRNPKDLPRWLQSKARCQTDEKFWFSRLFAGKPEFVNGQSLRRNSRRRPAKNFPARIVVAASVAMGLLRCNLIRRESVSKRNLSAFCPPPPPPRIVKRFAAVILRGRLK